tara:strand:+ start:54 stop:797 length:744 start_codon:yes stop_codon:yes gene_type:complete
MLTIFKHTAISLAAIATLFISSTGFADHGAMDSSIDHVKPKDSIRLAMSNVSVDAKESKVLSLDMTCACFMDGKLELEAGMSSTLASKMVTDHTTSLGLKYLVMDTPETAMSVGMSTTWDMMGFDDLHMDASIFVSAMHVVGPTLMMHGSVMAMNPVKTSMSHHDSDKALGTHVGIAWKTPWSWMVLNNVMSLTYLPDAETKTMATLMPEATLFLGGQWRANVSHEMPISDAKKQDWQTSVELMRMF